VPQASSEAAHLEQSNELSPKLASRYLQLIATWWQHDWDTLKGLYHMVEYLRKHEMTRIVFDPFHPKVDESVFASGTTD
jgi:hypothetical protein